MCVRVAMAPVHPLPDHLVEDDRDIESAVPVVDVDSPTNPGDTSRDVPGDEIGTNPFSVPEDAFGDVEAGTNSGDQTNNAMSTQIDSKNTSRTFLPPGIPGQKEAQSKTTTDGSQPPTDKFSVAPTPQEVLTSNEIDAIIDAPSSTQIWSSINGNSPKRPSIGADGEFMEQRSFKVQKKVGRPNVKSIFHAMAGVQVHGDDGSEMHPKLIAVDIDAYGEQWTTYEKKMTLFYFIIHALAWLALTFVDPDSWLRVCMKNDYDLQSYSESDSTIDSSAKSSSQFDTYFWSKMVVQQCAIWIVFSCCGLLVVTKGWNEGYSRKICHVVMYLMPFLMHIVWPKDNGGESPKNALPSIWVMSWTVWFQFVPFYLQIKPARRRSTFLMLVFRAYDRAQDRPYTLTWLLTQLGAGYAVILALYLYLQTRGVGVVPEGAEKAILIPIVVNVFGDGLAEPVGIAFGKHKYRARALWYKGKCCAGEFKRTLEGSFVVYLSALLAVIPCRTKYLSIFSVPQYAFALALLPPLMSITEAFAPHTWDNPLITLVGAVFLLGVYELVP